jgi:hypothetical protein
MWQSWNYLYLHSILSQIESDPSKIRKFDYFLDSIVNISRRNRGWCILAVERLR